ncbi:MAG: hypothetical protein N2043_02160 [Ignavibacterium sp.]|nr:hypothetical protein [Ignavibacterium sp.]
MDLDRLTNTFDFRLDENGDLILTNDWSGDISMVNGVDYLIQQVEIRIKESDIDDLIGEKNTMEVAEKGKGMIISALTYDGLIDFSDIYVEAVPISPHVLYFYVFVKSPIEAYAEQNGEEVDEDPIGFEVSLHLSHGSKIRRIK